MIKKYTTALLLAGLVGASGSAFAQKAGFATAVPAKVKSKAAKNTMVQAKDYADAFFYEDFDGGIPAGWEVATQSGDVSFAWTNTGGIGEYLNPLTGTTTLGNGWIIVDSDGYGVSGVPENTTLTTPVIDLTTHETVTLSIEQYYRAFTNSQCEIGYSTDGGANFTYIVVNEQYAPNTGTPNPQTFTMNMSPYIGGESNVKIRFRWTGEWDYGWQFDDFALVEPQANDLSITDSYYDGGVLLLQNEEWLDVDYLEQIEYSRYAQGQVRPLTFVGEIYNIGTQDQTNVALGVTVTTPEGEETFTSEGVDLAPGDTVIVTIDDVMLDAFADGGALGDYTVEFTAISDSVDTDMSNNSATKEFIVDENLMSLDNMDGTWDSFFPDLNTSVIFGTRYVFTEPIDVQYIEFVIGESVSQGYISEENVVFPNIRIGSAYEETNTETVFGQFEPEFLVTEDMISSGSTAIWITAELPSVVTLEPNTVYQAEVFSQEGPLYFAAANEKPKYSGIAGEVAADGTVSSWVGLGADFGVAPLIRFVVADGGVGVENAGKLNFRMDQSYPNPATSGDQITIGWELMTAADNVNFVVTDNTGKTVFQKYFGTVPAGVQNDIVLNTDLAAGVYQYSLLVGNRMLVKKFVITK